MSNSIEHHLILGGCGFIGRHVATLLARAGHQVMLGSRTPNMVAFPPDIRERISWRHFDLATTSWEEIIASANVVHHYAWTSLPEIANREPAGDLMANVFPTINLLEALRSMGSGAPVLLFASSGGTVYGRLKQVPAREDHPVAPITCYGAAKAAVEMYLGTYRDLYGLDCRVARLANPFGAGQDSSRGFGSVNTFIQRALADLPIVLFGDGEVVRDYIHISDAAAGLVALATAPVVEGSWIFNIGSGQGASLNDVVTVLEMQLGRLLEVRHEEGRAFDVPVSVLDISLARDMLDWSPQLTFSDGVARTLLSLEKLDPRVNSAIKQAYKSVDYVRR